VSSSEIYPYQVSHDFNDLMTKVTAIKNMGNIIPDTAPILKKD
jgi:hypothetical protein